MTKFSATYLIFNGATRFSLSRCCYKDSQMKADDITNLIAELKCNNGQYITLLLVIVRSDVVVLFIVQPHCRHYSA